MAADTPIPDEPHRRSLRWDDWLVRRTSPRRVRVTSPHGYVDVAMGRGATVADATDLAASEIESGRAAWTPLPPRSGGRTRTKAERAATGLNRVEVWFSGEAMTALGPLVEHFGSVRAALEYAVTHAPHPQPKAGA